MPDAYYRVQDLEAKRFISRCLANASERSSARELLLDPFVLLDDHIGPMPSLPNQATKHAAMAESINPGHILEVCKPISAGKRTDMTITGRMDPEDDAIILKVQIADEQGAKHRLHYEI